MAVSGFWFMCSSFILSANICGTPVLGSMLGSVDTIVNKIAYSRGNNVIFCRGFASESPGGGF